MHVDSFAELSETLNCYIKKYYMKWNTGIIVKIVASTIGDVGSQFGAQAQNVWSLGPINPI